MSKAAAESACTENERTLATSSRETFFLHDYLSTFYVGSLSLFRDLSPLFSVSFDDKEKDQTRLDFRGAPPTSFFFFCSPSQPVVLIHCCWKLFSLALSLLAGQPTLLAKCTMTDFWDYFLHPPTLLLVSAKFMA